MDDPFTGDLEHQDEFELTELPPPEAGLERVQWHNNNPIWKDEIIYVDFFIHVPAGYGRTVGWEPKTIEIESVWLRNEDGYVDMSRDLHNAYTEEIRSYLERLKKIK